MKKQKQKEFDRNSQYKLVWEDGKFGTFKFQELITEDEKTAITAIMAIAKGYKVGKLK